MTPDAPDIAAAAARLRADPEAIARARAALASRPQRSIADMAADYRALLPLARNPPARYALSSATADRLVASMRAGEIGAAQRMVAALRAEIHAQQRELERRGEWGMSLDR